MTIRKKLLAGYLLLGFFLIVQAAISFYFNDQAKELADKAIEKNFEASLRLSDLTILAQKMRRYEKEAFIYVTEPKRRAKYLGEWEDAYEAATKDLQAMVANRDGIFTSGDIQTMRRWQQGLAGYGSEFHKVAKAMTRPGGLEGKPETAANAMIQDGKRQVAPLLREAPKMSKEKHRQAREFVKEIESNYETAEMLFTVLTLLGLGLSGLILFVLPGQITTALHHLIDQGERLSLGTQTEEIATTTVPEFDRLARALRRIQVTHGALIERLRRKGLPTDPNGGG